MKIIIKKGEPLWSQDGRHVLDDKGFAVLSEDLHKEIIISNPDAIERVKKSLPRERWDEVYLLAINSSEQFLKDKETELAQLQKEQFGLLNKSVQEQEEAVRLEFAKTQEQILAEQKQFEESQRKLQAELEAEQERILKQKQEEEAAMIAKSEAEMAALKARLEPVIAERKLREAEEAAAAEAEKKAQQELIASLLERIQKLEEGK